jgi:N-hydroxyarylamine O-acetyltransferase
MEGREEVNLARYLSRIGFDGVKPAADLQGLRFLQRFHLLHVPFENLDIHWQRPIVLSEDEFYTKIVVENRGGFCYELNGLFNQLLRGLGFRTRLISARVHNGTDYGPEFDHAAIIVTIGELEYLADVGFGDFTAEPLRVVTDFEQLDREGKFVIRRAEYGNLEVTKIVEGISQRLYKYSLLGRDLSEFAEMCDFQQYAPESHFRKGKLCSIMTDDGRKTLTDKSFILTSNGEKTETPINSDSEFYEALEREFGIVRQVTTTL